ncbi:hypothetical protein B0F90DRAFT_1824300 [Multifurca ochricompacta]|uniref:CCHC-type domain-containing protein n=1 Tax=Multifurca ochricompacta TaxID=376703 RepID=A0AAD4LVG3_9AGAM|nr:hypothetical protein B0F90DRAFT_1824300 [Multifurca ochricompacta]
MATSQTKKDPLAASTLLGGRPRTYTGAGSGVPFMDDFIAFWTANRHHPSLSDEIQRTALALTYIQGPGVDKWKHNWILRLQKTQSESGTPVLWAPFIKDFEHAFAKRRGPRPVRAGIGLRGASGTAAPNRRPAQTTPTQRQSLPLVQGLSRPTTLTPAPALPPPPVETQPGPALQPAAASQWPGPVTYQPTSAWPGPITFIRAMQLKHGRCFRCNKKGHVIGTCTAEQPDKKAQRAEAPPQNPPQKDRAPPPAVAQPGSSKTTTTTTTTTPTQRSQQVAAIVLAAAGVTLTSPVPPGGLVPAAGVMLRPTQRTRQTARRGGHTSSDSSRAGSARTSPA